MLETMAGWRGGNDIASGAGAGFDSRAGRIEHNVANGASPLRYFFGLQSCVAQAPSCGDATRYMLRHNTVSIMKI